MWGAKTELKCKDCDTIFTDKEHFERHKKVHKK
ncbi:MAG: hypothetical protein KGH87_08600 [Thaumarchaeota archaeon]|nr:hypothetical protein [Nitrososphaerota archaeon]MDE1839963.1 hypothetical protein [Nitrososphaerota archaeon]MDE1840830.1 hypothetical protein [Nitrososphaerota archaeon]MDE1878600.1 hypothetical protein [Nitrososphaerota archaeon]